MLPTEAWRVGLNRIKKPVPRSTSLEYESESQSTSFRRLSPPRSRYKSPRRQSRAHPLSRSPVINVSDASDSEDQSPAGKRNQSKNYRRRDNNGRPRSLLCARIVASLYGFFCTIAHAVFRVFLHFLWTFGKMVVGILLQPVWVIARNLAGPLFVLTFFIPLVLHLSFTILDPRGAVKMLRLPAAPAIYAHPVVHLPETPTIRIELAERSRRTEAMLSRLSLDFERSRIKGEEMARLNAERLQRLEDALSGFSLHYERIQSEIAAEARLNAVLAGKIGVLETQQSVRKAQIATHAAASSELNNLRKDLEALQLLVKAFQPPRDVARPDFALHSSGAAVIPSLTSPTYALRRSTLHGRIWGYITGNGVLGGRPPVTALHYDIHDGHCWPFAGSQGQLGVVLSAPVYIEDITIDHVAAAVAVNGRTSAPRDMEIWAMVEGQDNVAKLKAWRAENTQRRDHEPARPKMLPTFPEYIRIASFQYNIHSPNSIQTFPVDAEIKGLGIDFGVVVLMVKSNWGMDEYTCLYRVRVHGQRTDASASP
ncbi:hypothetical protein B0H11DRAFT_2253262 [Mycena galericulata]|nr:hypothetical protein B0H11DRAFT_2253262 [Mycena galericulata]